MVTIDSDTIHLVYQPTGEIISIGFSRSDRMIQLTDLNLLNHQINFGKETILDEFLHHLYLRIINYFSSHLESIMLNELRLNGSVCIHKLSHSSFVLPSLFLSEFHLLDNHDPRLQRCTADMVEQDVLYPSVGFTTIRQSVVREHEETQKHISLNSKDTRPITEDNTIVYIRS